MIETNEQLIENILYSGGFTSVNEALHGWVIVIDDKVYKPRAGTFIYKTRKQAVKALYNGLSWIVLRHYAYFRQRRESVSCPPWVEGCWRQKGEYWKDFKKYLGKRLKFIQV